MKIATRVGFAVGVGALSLLAASTASGATTPKADGARDAAAHGKRVSSSHDPGRKPLRSASRDKHDKAAEKAPAHAAKAAKKGADGEKLAKGEIAGGTGEKHARLASRTPHAPHGAAPAPAACLNAPIELARGFGGESESIVLTRCDGRPAPLAIERLSIFLRPTSAPRPAVPATPVRHGSRVKEWRPGVKLVDSGLVTRLGQIADHFKTAKLTIVSGYRPASAGSFHQSARAVDLHVDGVSNEDLVSYCRTLKDTGCGYYPNSSFVHVDVRGEHSGHVYWIDASGPGEAPRYVSSWPPPEATPHAVDVPRPDPAAPGDENTHPDAVAPPLPPGASDAKVDAQTTAPAIDDEAPADDAPATP